MSEISFPIKDLMRRKFQTGLTIIGLTISTAATVFLILFGENIGLEIAVVTGGRLTTVFSNVFSRFIFMVSLLDILAGALVTFFLVYLSMSERVHDVGIMKAIGCLTNIAFGYFFTELSIIIFTSCIAGTVIGVLTYLASINVLNAMGFPILQSPISLWTILLIFLIFVVASHILGTQPIIRAIRVKAADALSPLYSFGTTSNVEFGKPSSSKLGLTFKMAYRALMRRSSATRRAIICLAAVLTLTTVTIAGGIIASQTTQSYVERAVSRDVVVVGHSDLSRRYVNLLSQFFEAKETEEIDYLNLKYDVSESVVSELNAIPGVLKVDPRLVLEATVYEVQGVIIDPEEPGQYVPVGDHRSGKALVLGVQPNNVINEWLVLERFLNETDVYSAVIGDSLALEMFTNPQKQAVTVFEKNFEIAGVCLDPLNNGNVVYVPLNVLSTLVDSQHNYNLVFLKINQSRRLEVLAEIEKMGLTPMELNGVLGRHLAFLSYLWSFVMFLPLFSLATAVLCLLSYMMLSVAGQQKEFGIMRALGAKPKMIMKIVFMEALIITLISGAVGIFVGLFFTFVFLIPEPVISQFTLFSVVGLLLLALSLLCLFSLYPALRVVKKSVASVLSQP
jgi:ABC-type antimicrobial peptide transport system permease subunit